MPISVNDLTELREQIAAGRKKLEEQEAALHVLEAMLADTPIPVNGKNHLDNSLLPNEPVVRKSLPMLVNEIVKQFGKREFIVADIENVLARQGNLPKTKTPRASIATALQQMEKNKELTRTYRGVGSDPHRFRLN